MYFFRKLKPNTKSFRILLIVGLSLAIYSYVALTYGLRAGTGVCGILVIIYAPGSFIDLLRSKNPYFLVPLIFQLSAASVAGVIALGDLERHRPLIVGLFIIVFFFLIWAWILMFTRKLKWRYREVLELAAMPIKDVTNGYTARPRSSGKSEFSEIEIKAFARFLLYHLIAIPHFERERIVFSLNLSFRHRLGILTNYTDHTYVTFNLDGNVSAFISMKDYLKYQEQLAFDQLCESLGNLFIEFFELFKNGEGIRVIDRMNSLRLNPLEDFGES